MFSRTMKPDVPVDGKNRIQNEKIDRMRFVVAELEG